ARAAGVRGGRPGVHRVQALSATRVARPRRGHPPLGHAAPAHAAGPRPADRHTDPRRQGRLRRADAAEARRHGRAEDRSGPRAMRHPKPDQGGPAVMAPFLLRRLWLSIVPRTGGAPLVPPDPSALAASPGLTW